MVSLKGLVKSLFDHTMEGYHVKPKMGHWTSVARSAKIGTNVKLGDWSDVGAFSRIGDNVRFGPWAKVANDVVIYDNVRLGSYTRVTKGSVVPAGTFLDDHDLFTPNGIIKDRCSGSMIQMQHNGDINIMTHGAVFMVPAGVYADTEEASDVLDIWMWGDTHPDPRKDLAQYKI